MLKVTIGTIGALLLSTKLETQHEMITTNEHKNMSIRILLIFAFILAARVIGYGQPADLLMRNAATEIQQKNYDNALHWVDSALVLQPKNVSFIIERASVLIALERYAEAMTETAVALDLDSNQAAAYVMRAKATLGIGEWSVEMVKNVNADFSRAVSLEPNNVSWYVYRSEGYVQLGKMREAEADLTKAIGLDPTQPDLYFRRGMVRSELGNPEQYSKAHEDFNKAISLAPREAGYYAQRAVNNWHTLIKDPNDTHPKFDEKDPLINSIQADIKQALKLDPAQWLALAYRGETRYKINMNRGKNPSKDRFQSIDDLLASLKANPRDNPAKRFLGNIFSLDYPVEKMAAGLEAALAFEKAYFEKNILQLKGTESLTSFTLASQITNLKSNPKFDLSAYLSGLAATDPGNLCYQLHNDRARYNWSFELKEKTFTETLSKPFDTKYNQCACEMALDLARHYKTNLFNAMSPDAANASYAAARKWVERADEIYPGSAAYLATEIEETKTKKDDYLAKNYKAPTSTQAGNTKGVARTDTPQENLLIDEYNRLVSARIPHLQQLQSSLQSSVADYMNANQMARVWMHRKIYNQCSGVINSHEAFITSLNNLLQRSYGVAPSLTPEINSQIRSVESAVNRLREVRYGLVKVL
ncbi:MAG: hypothetical protein KIT66_13490 [Chitinophagaceae bacterium]|nr:hypothetical protein [Chitinophagaceae bacterium]MCZ2397479.1 hypothetical protein [Chitinophagales bacterium]